MKASSNGSPLQLGIESKRFQSLLASIKDKVGHIYIRKDFYKINISTCMYIFHCADKSFETSIPVVFTPLTIQTLWL